MRKRVAGQEWDLGKVRAKRGKSEAKAKGRWCGESGVRGVGVAKVRRGMKGIFSKIS